MKQHYSEYLKLKDPRIEHEQAKQKNQHIKQTKRDTAALNNIYDFLKAEQDAGKSFHNASVRLEVLIKLVKGFQDICDWKDKEMQTLELAKTFQNLCGEEEKETTT